MEAELTQTNLQRVFLSEMPLLVILFDTDLEDVSVQTSLVQKLDSVYLQLYT